jgi:methylmalonyl-CoA mutase N-terminal domain/subunit
MPVDEFAPRLSFFFIAQADFFEQIAKFRALRRVYARMMRDEFGATRAESMRLRFHCQTAAITLTRTQPYNNVARTALQALCAVLGGAQSLHTNGLDEAIAIPSEFAMKLALRTQQIIAEETNVTSVADPLGGSWFVESLTNDFEQAIWEILDRVEAMGGTVRAIEESWFQQEMAEHAYQVARRQDTGERVVVGVNRYVDEDEDGGGPVPVHRVDPDTERRQVEHLRAVRAGRDQAAVEHALHELQRVAGDHDANLMPATIAAVRARASGGEVVRALRAVFGSYTETAVF